MCAPRLKANLTNSQQTIQDILVMFMLKTSPSENMPGRCFIGDRRLLNFNENMYCYNGKLLSVLEVPTVYAYCCYIDAEIGELGQCNIGLSMTGSKVSCVINVNFVLLEISIQNITLDSSLIASIT